MVGAYTGGAFLLKKERIKMKKTCAVLAALCVTSYAGVSIGASKTTDAGLATYYLENVTVYGDGKYDKFGNEVTAQSYYRTGGDVSVIAREEIERKHYKSLAEAIKTVPGVLISDTGFHGGMYGGGTYTSEVQINGDGHVVILLDGRRLDNGASNFAGHSSYGNSKNVMAMYLLNNMDLVEQIEVIKGPGASVYGSDATGGAINIITRRGSLQPRSAVDIGTGSWGRHYYAVNTSGSANQGKLRYYIAANQDRGGSTHYKDGLTGVNRKFIGTDFKDTNVTVKIDNDFDKTHRLSFLYNYSYDRSGMPLTAPDYRHLSNLLDDTLYHAAGGDYGWHNSDFWERGYRNWFIYEGLLGSYTETIAKNFSLTYVFANDRHMESFVRIFDEWTSYWNNRRGRLWGLPQSRISWLLEHWDTQTEIPQWSTRDREFMRGIQLQLGKHWGKHDVLFGALMTHSKWDRINPNAATNYFRDINSIKRNNFSAYVQDKIHVTDNWEVTPAFRYDHYGDYSIGTISGNNVSKSGKYSHGSLILSSQYLIDPSATIYASWAQVNRPLWSADFSSTFEKLNNEKGNAYNLGIRKVYRGFAFDVNYSYIDMSNAIGQYSVVGPNGKVSNRAINAVQKKRAINLGLHKKISDTWSVGMTYSYVHDDFKGKNVTVDPDTGTSVNVLVNSIRPVNKYGVDIGYRKDRFNADFSTMIYSGMNRRYFTDRRFIVSRLSMNYKMDDQLSVYAVVDNVFNEAWENKYYALCSIGAFPQSGRSFMFGVKYDF